MKATGIPQDFGPRLSALIAWAKIEKIQLAKEIGSSPSLISRICFQKCLPSQATVLLLRGRFSPLEWSWLVGETNDITKIPQRQVNAGVAESA